MALTRVKGSTWDKDDNPHTHGQSEVSGLTTKLNELDQKTDSLETEVGKKANAHSHPYLPASGGTLTGDIDLSNHSVKNTNRITFADASNLWDEGIVFPVDAGGDYSLRIDSGARPVFHDNGTDRIIYHDNYHPKADKLTTARTITLTGDLQGSCSFDGSGNVSLSGSVKNDSHSHDGRYYTEAECNSKFLGKTAKAVDADKLDGKDSSEFAASDHAHSNYLTMQGEKRTPLVYGNCSFKPYREQGGYPIKVQPDTDDRLKSTLHIDSRSIFAQDRDDSDGTFTIYTNPSNSETVRETSAKLSTNTSTLYSNGSERLRIHSSGVGVTGTLSATTDVEITSDRRVKTNITPIPKALDKVDQLSGNTYDRTDIEAHQAGLIAQELQAVLPEGVSEDENGQLSVKPVAAIALLVEAVKELRAEVDSLEKGASHVKS